MRPFAHFGIVRAERSELSVQHVSNIHKTIRVEIIEAITYMPFRTRQYLKKT